MKIASDELTRLNNINNMLFQNKKRNACKIRSFMISKFVTGGIPQGIFNFDPKAFSHFHVK